MTPSEILSHLQTRSMPAWDLLNGRLVDYDEVQRRAIMEWTAETRHCHSVEGHPRGGIVQGGIVTGWLDAAMASACLFQANWGSAVASLEIKVSFLLSAHPGVYRAYGSVTRIGRTVAFLEAELFDQDMRLIAKATSTAAVRNSAA